MVSVMVCSGISHSSCTIAYQTKHGEACVRKTRQLIYHSDKKVLHMRGSMRTWAAFLAEAKVYQPHLIPCCIILTM